MISIVKSLTEQHLASLKLDPTNYQKIRVVNKLFPNAASDDVKDEAKEGLRKFNGKFIKKFIQTKNE